MQRTSALARATLGGATLLALTALVGCSASTDTASDSPTAVTVWHTYSDAHADAFAGIVDDFNASQDAVVVEVLPQPFADFSSKVLQAVSNKSGPDIIVNS